MRNNVDAFLPFLTCPPPGPEEVLGPNGEDPGEDDGMMTLVGYERYCKRVESSGEWGGEPEVSLPPDCSVCFFVCRKKGLD
jgi:OTU domain-containing protein 6